MENEKDTQTILEQEVAPEDITIKPEEAARLGEQLERQEQSEELLAAAQGKEAARPELESEIDTVHFTKNDLLRLLLKRQYRELREATEQVQPVDLAEILEDMDENNRLVAFRLLRKSVAAEVFSYLDPDVRADMVEAFSDAELRTALEQMSLDDAADFLEDMPASVVQRILEKSSKKTRDSLNKLLHYPEDSAGSIMTPEYVRLRRNDTVSQAFDTIRRYGENAETVYTCFVVEKHQLIGVVSAKDLMLAELDEKIADIMDENVITVKVTDDKEFVARAGRRKSDGGHCDHRRRCGRSDRRIHRGYAEDGCYSAQRRSHKLFWHQRADARQAAHSLAAAADAFGNFYRHGDHPLRGRHFGAAAAGQLYAHAHGYRRQLRQPNQHADGARLGFGRSGNRRYYESALERAAGFRHRGHHAGRSERPAHFYHVHLCVPRAIPERAAVLSGGQHFAGGGRYDGQAGGRYAAAGRQAPWG